VIGAGAVAAGTLASYSGLEFYYNDSLRQFTRELYARKQLKVKNKGVTYGIAPTWYAPSYPTPVLDSLVSTDFGLIKNELGCNCIRIWGDNNDRLIKCAEAAVEAGFDVILLSPRYVNETIDKTIDTFGELSRRIGYSKLRSSILLAVGNELTVDAMGIYPGQTYVERVAQIEEKQHDKKCQQKLEAFLRDLIAVARRNTDVRLTYAAGSWEWMMPWGDLDLDVLGDNHYWYKEYGNPEDPNNEWFSHVRHFKQYGKPYFITEFGSGAFKGAFDLGGGAWMSGHAMFKDEDIQAAYIEEYIKMFNRTHEIGQTVDGCFLFDYYDQTFAIVNPGDAGAIGPKPMKSFFMYKSYQRSP
jgi:hypothetical protein